MGQKNGFTLLEVLIVVVIAVSVAAFAVPAYKKAQDRNRFLAAQGVLMDFGNGVRMLQQDIDFDFPTQATNVITAWQTTVLADDAEITSSNAKVALFARKYMAPIPFDLSNSYKGYYFSLCPVNTATTSNCCQGDSDVVVCMYDPRYSSRSTKGQYYGAVYLKDGTIRRITK